GLELRAAFSSGHIRAQATTEYNNATVLIATPNRLRRDSGPRFSTNRLVVKLSANPSSFTVVNLVPGRGNLGLHSLCIRKHVFQLVRKSRCNDVEISLL